MQEQPQWKIDLFSFYTRSIISDTEHDETEKWNYLPTQLTLLLAVRIKTHLSSWPRFISACRRQTKLLSDQLKDFRSVNEEQLTMSDILSSHDNSRLAGLSSNKSWHWFRWIINHLLQVRESTRLESVSAGTLIFGDMLKLFTFLVFCSHLYSSDASQLISQRRATFHICWIYWDGHVTNVNCDTRKAHFL